jgi:hypothetical protein
MSASAQAVATAPALQRPRLLDHVRAACRLRHYSLRHPLEMGAAQINQFLTHQAVDGIYTVQELLRHADLQPGVEPRRPGSEKPPGRFGLTRERCVGVTVLGCVRCRLSRHSGRGMVCRKRPGPR